MSRVLVVDAQRRPLMPCTQARARLLLKQGKAAVLRRFPFTLILQKAKPDALVGPLRVKIDPGARITGVAVVHDASGEVVWAAELSHRGVQVREALTRRRAVRRSRRARHTRYRAARWQNRRRHPGWVPPSLSSRVHNVLTWVQRLCRFCPIGAISLELVRFDLALLQNPSLESIAYQRGTPFGTELRQYLLAKWEHRCAYCGASGGPLEIDHVHPRAKGGSDRIANLVIACHLCNQHKGDQSLEVFLADQPEVLARVQEQHTAPLKDAAAVNSTRWALYERLQAIGLPPGNRLGWLDQMEENAAIPTQSPLGGRSLLRPFDPCRLETGGGPSLADHGFGSTEQANAQRRQTWLPDRPCQGAEPGAGISYGRSCQGGLPTPSENSGDPCGAGAGENARQFRYPDQTRTSQRDRRALL